MFYELNKKIKHPFSGVLEDALSNFYHILGRSSTKYAFLRFNTFTFFPIGLPLFSFLRC